MTILEVQDSTAQALLKLAKQTNQSVDEFLQDIVSQYQQEKLDNDEKISQTDASTGQRLLEVMLEANYSSGHSDTVERSREILNTEYVDYLKSRLDRDVE